MNRREMILALFVAPLCWLLGVKRIGLVGPPIYGKLWQQGHYQHPDRELQIRRFRITVNKCREYVRLFGPAVFIEADLREAQEALKALAPADSRL